jgi:ribose transport system substrate-binding protein
VGRTSHARPLASLIAAIMIAALSMFAVACGDDEASDGGGDNAAAEQPAGDDGQAAAKAAIEKNKAMPEFTLDAEPFDVSKAKGKVVFNIPVSSTIPYVAAVDQEMKKVAEEQGVEFIQFENEGSPTQWASGFNQAISRGVDLIIMQAGNDPRLVIPQLKRAKEAGIPVLVSHLYQNGEEPPAEVKDLITATVTVPFHESGQLSVDYAVAETGCADIKPIIITAKEVPPSDGIVNAMMEQLKTRCPDAETPKVINTPVTEWGTRIRPEVQSALQADPNVNWVLPIYDSMSLGAEAGIRAAGKANDVRIASYNGTPAILKLIQAGDIMAANMGENINWLGWANMDQAFRILADGPIIEDGLEGTPLRVFDDSNVADTGNPPTPDKGYGEAYVEGYRKLWGLD